jgi:hypothetical protein
MLKSILRRQNATLVGEKEKKEEKRHTWKLVFVDGPHTLQYGTKIHYFLIVCSINISIIFLNRYYAKL